MYFRGSRQNRSLELARAITDTTNALPCCQPGRIKAECRHTVLCQRKSAGTVTAVRIGHTFREFTRCEIREIRMDFFRALVELLCARLNSHASASAGDATGKEGLFFYPGRLGYVREGQRESAA